MASQNETFERNRAGLRPDDTETLYSISTKRVEEYLQKKTDVVVRKMNERADANPKMKHIDPFQINVISSNVSKTFVPFAVIFPMSVLINRGDNKKGGNDIFNPKKEDHSAQMYPEIKKLFDSVSYDHDDRNAFKSPNWKREHNVSRTAAVQLMMMSKPKITQFNRGRTKVVTLFIDPIRVFYDMVKTDDNRRYKIEIVGIERVKTGEYVYRVKKVYIKKNNQSYAKSFAEELNHKMQGRDVRHND